MPKNKFPATSFDDDDDPDIIRFDTEDNDDWIKRAGENLGHMSDAEVHRRMAAERAAKGNDGKPANDKSAA